MHSLPRRALAAPQPAIAHCITDVVARCLLECSDAVEIQSAFAADGGASGKKPTTWIDSPAGALEADDTLVELKPLRIEIGFCLPVLYAPLTRMKTSSCYA